MKSNRKTTGEKHRKSRAFTMPELLVVIVVIVVLVLLVIPALNRPYSKAPRIKCSSNLKQIALAFKMYAGDNNEKLPWEIAGDSVKPQLAQQTWKYFQTISNELGTAKILLCPGDLTRLQNVASNFSDNTDGLANPTNRNNAVSYFLGVFASSNQPNAILVGDRNLARNDKSPLYGSRVANTVEIATNSVWNSDPDKAHHDNAGNYALADGSVQQASTERLQEALKLARDSYGTNANRFLFPQ